MCAPNHFGQILIDLICDIRVTDPSAGDWPVHQPTRTMNVLGIQLSAPSLMGLIRMLGFTLTAIAIVEVADAMNSGVGQAKVRFRS